MFDHVGIVVKDLGIAKNFYDAVLMPLGIKCLQDNRFEDKTGWLVFGTDQSSAQSSAAGQPFFIVSAGRPGFWKDSHSPSQSPVHLAFSAPSKDAVTAFHTAGLATGGADNGAPGDRGDNYFASYLIDPDGNNVEAGFRG